MLESLSTAEGHFANGQYDSQVSQVHDDNQKRSELSYDVVDGGRWQDEEDEEGAAVVHALWIAIAVSSAVLLTCIIVYLLLKYKVIQKSRIFLGIPRRENHPLTTTTTNDALASSPDFVTTHLPDEWLGGVGAGSGGGFVHLGFVSTEEEEDWSSQLLNKLQGVRCLPRAQVQLPFEFDDEQVEKVAGHGKYGPIYHSRWQEKQIDVYRFQSPMKKKLVENGNVGSRGGGSEKELAKELTSLLDLSVHPNVVQTVGFFEEDPWLYLAVQAGGISVKSALLKYRGASHYSSRPLLMCAMGVAEALFHLHSHQMTHGQLCAWNVIIPINDADERTDFSQPKVTAFGPLSCTSRKKDLDYSRWMAAEQIHNRCAPPSDTWSYGILLWEICNLGGTPYHEIRNEDLKKRIERGARPAQGEHVSDDLYQIMLHCWQLDKEERPDPGALACDIHPLLANSDEHLFLSQALKFAPYYEAYEFHK